MSTSRPTQPESPTLLTSLKTGLLAWINAPPAVLAIVYLAAITLAEVLTTIYEPRVGLILHGILLVILLLHASLLPIGATQQFLLSLTLAPLIRLMSLSLPLPSFAFIYWYAIVGAPLFIAIYLVMRVTGITPKMIGVRLGNPAVQIMIGLMGIWLGFVEYMILRPSPLVPEFTWQAILLPAFILLIFTGFLEEVIFRGVMQYTGERNLGRYGITFVSAVFAALHVGYKSILDVFFVFAVAMLFGYLAKATKSILGVTVAHGLTNIGLFLIFPFLMPNAQPLFDTGSAAQPPPVILEATQALPAASVATRIPAPAATLVPAPLLAAVRPAARISTAQNPTTLDNELILIPAGQFQMGCDPANTQVRCQAESMPLHAVFLDAYQIDLYEVTNAQYAACVAAGACAEPASPEQGVGENHYSDAQFASYPVVQVSWFDANDYCTWVGKRLPSEAEWEKAARGTVDLRLYPWGSQSPDCSRLNFFAPGGACAAGLQPVGSYPDGASPYGVHDMAGNVAEWTADWYGKYYYSNSPATNPIGPDRGSYKATRGSSLVSMSEAIHIDQRAYYPLGYSSSAIGFRCTLAP